MKRVAALLGVGVLVVAPFARAQTGVPPADEAATVAQQKAAAALEENKAKPDATNAAINAGAQIATGNSRLVAVTAGGKIDLRRGNNGFAAALIANYATAYTAPVPATSTTAAVPGAWKDTVRNLQGKLRYERFFGPRFSAFLQVTGTHDAFQATTFRLNVDPGVKYLLVNEPKTKFWGEVGYDFEFDVNYTDSNGFEQAGAGGQVLDANGLPFVIQQTNTMHSARAYVGFQHAFNKEVQFSTGLEFLQGFGGSDGDAPAIPAGYTAAQVDLVSLNLTRTRVNFDALLAANIAKGLSIGVGFTAKYNSAPLPGKENLDTTTTLSLIFAFARPAPAAPDATPTCPTTPAPVVMVPTSTPSTDAATHQPFAQEGFTKTLATGYAIKASAGGAESALVAFVEDPQKKADSSTPIELDRVKELDADASKAQLRDLAEILKAYPNVSIEITADTAAHADAVRAALVSAGAAEAHVTAKASDATKHVTVRVTAK